MTNKYVIRNCPTLMENHLCFGRYTRSCADYTDCLLKKIVEHCRETINIMCADCGSNPYAMGRDLEARLILQKFEIEE